MENAVSENWIHPNAQVGNDCHFGFGVVVEDDVVLGNDCQIGHHVVLRKGTRLGNNVRVDDHSVLGKLPMRSSISIFKDDVDYEGTEVGDNTMIGASVVIYIGAKIGERVLVADQSAVREEVSIGDNTIVGRGVLVENKCTIGKYVKLESETYITAYSTIEDRVFVAPGVVTTNDNFAGRSEERFKHFKGVTIRRGGRVGGGAVILPGCTIEADGMVAAGAVVTRDVPSKKIAIGAPARFERDVPDDQLLDNQDWPDVKADRSAT
jgi:acetyltransferase-like isoleucine patch superfamily enzyme